MTASVLADLGNLTLIVALGLSIYSAVTSGAAAWRPGSLFWSTAVRAMDMAAVLLTAAVGLQGAALASDRFQLVYVATNSSRELSLVYAISALWSGDKGSLILWTWAICLCSTIATRQQAEPRLLRTAVAVGAVVQASFIALVINSRPFALLPFSPLNGQGMNPSLQTPWMFLHPLPLYFGYAAITFPFTFALAAMFTGDPRSEWARESRRWAVGGWSLLTVAMVFGAQWAAREKGWGGFWGWDPVENAALLTWLSSAALIHSIVATQRRSILRVWSLFLGCSSFVTVLIAAFISRGGVVPSIHAFGASGGALFFLEAAGAALLIFVCVLAGRVNTLGSAAPRSPISRESTLGFTNVVLALLALVVLAATLAPWITKGVQGRGLVLGPGFYVQVTAPLWVALVGLMGACPLVGFGATASWRTLRSFLLPAGIGVAAGTSAALAAGNPGTSGAFSLVVFAIAATLLDFQRGMAARMRNTGANPGVALVQAVSRARQHYGGYTVHIGVLLAGLGMVVEIPFAEGVIWIGVALIGAGTLVALYPEFVARPAQRLAVSSEGAARTGQPVPGSIE